jgi:uncharacterized membrane protein
MTPIPMIGSALHRILLSFPTALFPAALVTDIAYLRTAQLQWTNFSAWLIAGALVFTGVVLAWSLVDVLIGFASDRRRRGFIYPALLALLFVTGLLNAFKHSQDAWSSVGTFGLILSILSTLLALAAAAIAYSGVLNREVIR